MLFQLVACNNSNNGAITTPQVCLLSHTFTKPKAIINSLQFNFCDASPKRPRGHKRTTVVSADILLILQFKSLVAEPESTVLFVDATFDAQSSGALKRVHGIHSILY